MKGTAAQHSQCQQATGGDREGSTHLLMTDLSSSCGAMILSPAPSPVLSSAVFMFVPESSDFPGTWTSHSPVLFSQLRCCGAVPLWGGCCPWLCLGSLSCWPAFPCGTALLFLLLQQSQLCEGKGCTWEWWNGRSNSSMITFSFVVLSFCIHSAWNLQITVSGLTRVGDMLRNVSWIWDWLQKKPQENGNQGLKNKASSHCSTCREPEPTSCTWWLHWEH